jgi:hypothetical protein
MTFRFKTLLILALLVALPLLATACGGKSGY